MSSLKVSAAAGLALAMAAVPCVAAEPVVTIETSYYDVGGKSAPEIRRQINKYRPADHLSPGDSYDARADWNIGWSYTSKRVGDLCEIDTSKVELRVTYTLPRWTNADKAKSALLGQWTRYMTALQRHEEGHKDVALVGARRIQTQLENFGPAPCAELSERIKARADKEIAVTKAANAEYDRITKHGATQGAQFP